MRDRTTLDEVRAALESPPPAVQMTTPAGADRIGTNEVTGPGAGSTTRDAQVRNEVMDRPETTDGSTTATASPETPSINAVTEDSGPAAGPTGLSTADMAAAGANSTANAASMATRGSGDSTAPGAARTAGGPADETPLFASDQAGSLRTRWQDVQTAFVDEPRSAVQNADALVAEAMQQLAAMFASERRSLEQQWSEGQQISTEDLRIALQRYRSFFNRLLSV